MANARCTLLVDSGADISIFKLSKIHPTQPVNTSIRTKLTGITDGEIETLAMTETELNLGNNIITKHRFHIVGSEFPIQTDGILGRDFLTSHRCQIDYECWILNLIVNNHPVSIPIEDTVNEQFIIPQRCEVIRKLANLNIQEDMVVHSQ